MRAFFAQDADFDQEGHYEDTIAQRKMDAPHRMR